MSDPISWFEVAQFTLSAASPLVLLLLQRSRTEQGRWRMEVREEQHAVRRDLTTVKEITADVRVKVVRVEEWGRLHEEGDRRDFAGVHDDIRELRTEARLREHPRRTT